MECSQPFFSFNVPSFLGDLVNIALDTCADVYDEFERTVCELEPLPQQDRALLQQAVEALFQRSVDSLQQSVVSFERLGAVSSLHVPPELFLEQPCPSTSAAVAAEDEQALDAELQALRQNYHQVKQECQDLRKELRSLNRDLRAAGPPSQYEPLAESLATSKQAVLDNMAAIRAAVGKLQPLLEAAGQMQQGSARREEEAGVESYRDAAEAQRHVHQQMADVGASLQQLQALRTALRA